MRGRKPAVRRGMLVVAVLLGLAVGALALAAIEAAAMPVDGEGTVSTAAADDASEPVVDGLLDQAYTFQKYYTLTRTGSGEDDVLAPGYLYAAVGETECYWAFVVDRGYNSNVCAQSDQDYLNQDGWEEHHHTFTLLERSDHAEFNVTYDSNTFDIWLDYINASKDGSAYASGELADSYGSGIQSPLSAAATSLHWNLLYSRWDGGAWGDELTQSPPYTYNWTDNYWEWNLIYEFSIPKSVMDGQCGTVEQAGAHNSPSKELENMASIGDRVWEDLDQDGIQDPGEPGVSGVLVYLIDGQGNTIRTTQTNPQGWYIFNNLAGGDYIVEFALPDGYQFTLKNQGADPSVDSDANPTTGRTAVIGLGSREADMTWDAGIYSMEAHIIVEKQTDPDGSGQEFEFDASYYETVFSLSDGEQDDSGDLDPGTYSVAENVPDGWDLIDVTCTSSKGDTETEDAISLQAGETVRCVFTDQEDANPSPLGRTARSLSQGPQRIQRTGGAQPPQRR